MPHTPGWTDPYLWPAEGGAPSDVLRNRYGIRDPDQLAAREYRETTLRSIEIEQGRADIPATGDAAEWRAIHRHLFSNVYDWAGQFRTVRLYKGEFEFASPSYFEDYLAEVSAEIREIDWAALDQNQFIDRAARTHMLLNFIHPFREGNGRSEKLFLDRQISGARWELDYSHVDTEEWNWAGMWSRDTHGRKPTDHRVLIGVFRRITVPRADPATPTMLDPTNYRDLAIILGNIRAQTAGTHIGDAIDAAGLTGALGSDLPPTTGAPTTHGTPTPPNAPEIELDA
ncbi:Fic family protein [Nocardia abscessus]|uniref:Fic/DOC family protein n=1 Tax=Nocardia abscessus TaxID=120957 RepID=UPI00189495ED|nr:Fic family protein [Nocardia abscessus]MBF6341308.1 Fic family protein [Nocardia abscessus]